MTTAADEYRHDQADVEGLWADTLWVSVVDREANVFGIIHFQLTNKGYARYESLFVIDGVQQQYGNKYPLAIESDKGPWTDGVLKYEVVKPLEEIRITFDWTRFAFDLTFKGRFPVFDYDDSVNGNPFHVSMILKFGAVPARVKPGNWIPGRTVITPGLPGFPMNQPGNLPSKISMATTGLPSNSQTVISTYSVHPILLRESVASSRMTKARELFWVAAVSG